jgi:hypothetical protein
MSPEEPAELVERGDVREISCGGNPNHEDVPRFVTDVLELGLHM